MGERYKSIQTLYNAEERGEIPKADREPRGKVLTRVWDISQLPGIGKKFGFLKKPEGFKQKVYVKFLQKGGVLKTTTTFNEGRTLALNGLKVLFIPLDPELSLTDIVLPQEDIVRLDQYKSRPGLFQFFTQGVELNKIIQPTSLPTLDIIPETHELVALEKWMSRETRREYMFSDHLLPQLSEYDVIIFDNSPTWNNLVENSLEASQAIVMPLGCNLLAYNAAQSNMDNIYTWKEKMHLQDQEIIMFTSLLERNSLSQQIYATYLSQYAENIINTPIRRSVKFEEALMSRQTILEYAPTSPQAEEYYELIMEQWFRLNNCNPNSVAEVPSQKVVEV